MGGLYCSTVLRRPSEHAGLLPLAVGAHLGSALREAYSVPLVLKWPNDLLVAHPGRPPRKLAGILADEVPSPTLGRAVVVGVGINVRLTDDSLPPDFADVIVTLDEFARNPPRLEDVEGILTAALHRAAEGLSHPEQVEEVRALCRQLLFGIGRRVTVDGRPAGTLEKLGDEGELWVATDTNRVAIWAGDVRVEDSP